MQSFNANQRSPVIHHVLALYLLHQKSQVVVMGVITAFVVQSNPRPRLYMLAFSRDISVAGYLNSFRL